MSLWQGRFTKETNPQMWALNASIHFDRRMAVQDVCGSLAWAQALAAAGVLTGNEVEQISNGLREILEEFQKGDFIYQPGDEDIHTAVERRLGELIGTLAGKLHTGRSRNDQVATDLRLWLLEKVPILDAALADLQKALLVRAEADFGILMPGYTHLQRAQPILISHWWLSHFWPLQRDRQRLSETKSRIGILPLGSGALAGVPFKIDRRSLAEKLGFVSPGLNSIDAVSDRDFAVEFLFVAALVGTHLSKLSEAVVIFASDEFDFLELDDAYSTGSSLMPQKKNPDPFELARGQSGNLLGFLTGLLVTLKGLPSAYEKDLQGDKEPVFGAFDTLMALLPVVANAIRSLTVNVKNLSAAIESMMMATDLADFLVEKGLPFREAHRITGEIVRFSLESKRDLAEITVEEYQAFFYGFDDDVYQVFDPRFSIARRNSLGGTAPESVKAQIEEANRIFKRGV